MLSGLIDQFAITRFSAGSIILINNEKKQLFLRQLSVDWLDAG